MGAAPPSTPRPRSKEPGLLRKGKELISPVQSEELISPVQSGKIKEPLNDGDPGKLKDYFLTLPQLTLKVYLPLYRTIGSAYLERNTLN